MTASTILFLLLVLACPLMMLWMMRGGHGHGHGSHADGRATKESTEDLRRVRAELDRLIEEREETEQRSPAGAPR